MSKEDVNTNKGNIEKFEGSFSTEQGGCSVLINSTLQSITDGFALGIYCYLMSLPNTWKLNVHHLANHFGCGKDKIYKYLRLLKDMNLLTCKTIRDGGKFAKLHYMLHLTPKHKKTQSDKGISPRLEKPETVNPDMEKADTYKTNNIQNKQSKKTTTTLAREKSRGISSSKPIINEKVDAELLDLREKHLEADEFERTDEEFLRQCSHHLDNGDKNKYNLSRRLKGLKSIIMKGFFETPAGYKENKIVKSLYTPEETVLLQTYQHALRMQAFGMKLEDYMPEKEEIKKAIKLLEKMKETNQI